MQPEVTGIDTLLEHLRLRGIPVSTVEMQRLSAVFQSEPHMTRPELRELLCALLAKDDTQRRTLRRLFEQLIPFEEASASPETTDDPSVFLPSLPRQALEAETQTPQTKPKQPTDYWFIGSVSILLLALLMLVLWFLWDKPTDTFQHPSQTETGETKPPPPSQSPPEEKTASDLDLVDSVEVWRAEVEVKPQDPLWKLLPNLILFVGAGLGFFWLLNEAIQRTWIRTPEPPLLRAQPGRFHLPHMKNLADYHLLSGADQREMSWGINHYLTDLPFHKLDIPASVEATARSGLPAIEYLHASREREVWLWQDQDSGNADLLKLAEEIGDTLRAAKIEVQRGYFRGLPDMIRSERGEVIWSTKHEYPEHQPLVVVLVDGNSLAQMGALQKPEAHTAFRQLGHWATLCLVDCSQQPGNLCSVTKPYDLDCLQPHEVAGWLARQGEPPQTQVTACAIDSLHLWAVACSLPERALMEDEMRALHDTLGLNCAWQYHALRRYAEPAGLGLDFSRSRLMLLQEFSRLAERDAALVDTVITFWRQRTDEIDAALCAEETERRPWKDTLKQQRLYLERALLGLWGRASGSPPDKGELEGVSSAAQTLYDLHALPKLQAEVERRLGQYTCLGWEETPGVTPASPGGWICLPQPWGALPPQTQHQLKAAGLGGKAEKLPLRWDRMTNLLLGLLFGLMLMAAGHGVWQWMPKSAKIQLAPNSAKPPTTALQFPAEIKKDTDTLWIGTAKNNVEKREIHPNDTVLVKWVRQIQTARIRLPKQSFTESSKEDNAELWLAGENVRPERPPHWPLVSIAVIASVPDEAHVQQIAAALLDNGAADQVLIGKNWWKHHKELYNTLGGLKKAQWLYITHHRAHVNTDEIKNLGEDIGYINMDNHELKKEIRQIMSKNISFLKGENIIKGKPKIITLYPGCLPFFDNENNPIRIKVDGEVDITPKAPPLNTFDLDVNTTCGAPGEVVDPDKFQNLLRNHPDVLERIRAFTGNRVYTNRPIPTSAETYLKDLTDAWFSIKAFEHIMCGQPGDNGIGGLHFYGRYAQLQASGEACRLDNYRQNEVMPGAVYTIGMAMKGADGEFYRHSTKGYGLTLNAEDILKAATRAFAENPTTSQESTACVLPITDDGINFAAAFVRQTIGIRTFYPDATPSPNDPSCAFPIDLQDRNIK